MKRLKYPSKTILKKLSELGLLEYYKNSDIYKKVSDE